MKKKVGIFWKIIGGIVVLYAVAFTVCFLWQHEGPAGWGPFTGVVLDAETREPIEGAQVFVDIIELTPGTWESARSFRHLEFAQTNRKGKYRVGKYVMPRLLYGDTSYEFKIYKAGYVCYDKGMIFKHTDEGKRIPNIGIRRDFKVKGNVVLLEAWDDTIFSPHDHSGHVQFMGIFRSCPSDRTKTALKYCEEAREELIIDCMAIWARFPNTRKQCEELVERDYFNNY